MTLVWVGHGECERLEAGRWVRRPEFDYRFTVEQRRFSDHWASVKSMQRHHPEYDGSAGPRTQTYFFRLDLDAGAAVSTLGTGTFVADAEFREATLELLVPDASAFAPFDRYRIAQRYDYEGGRLTETVALDRGETAWVRNRETATLFAPGRFEAPPTRR
jgi:hypothetical protein